MLRLLSTLVIGWCFSAAAFGQTDGHVKIARVFAEPGKETVEMKLQGEGTSEVLYVSKETAIGDADLVGAKVKSGTQVSIEIQLNEAGAQKLADLTKESVGQRLAFIVDGKLASAPMVREVITGGSLQISGNLTEEEVKQVVKAINQGKP